MEPETTYITVTHKTGYKTSKKNSAVQIFLLHLYYEVPITIKLNKSNTKLNVFENMENPTHSQWSYN